MLRSLPEDRLHSVPRCGTLDTPDREGFVCKSYHTLVGVTDEIRTYLKTGTYGRRRPLCNAVRLACRLGLCSIDRLGGGKTQFFRTSRWP